MIRIDAIVIPFYGHISPMLFALKKLVETYPNTYDVRVITGASKQALVEEAGFLCEIIQPNDPYIFERIAFAKKKMPMIYQFKEVNRRFVMLTDEIYEHLNKRKPDIIWVDFVTYPGVSAAIKTGIPWVTSIPTPFAIANQDGTPALFGGLSEVQNGYHRFRNVLARSTIDFVKRSQFFLYRKERSPYLHQLYRENGEESFYSPYGIVALGIESFQFKRTWPSQLKFVGYGAVHEQKKLQVTKSKEQKRILITMGTMASHKSEEAFQVVRKIAPNYPEYQFIVSRGNSNDDRHVVTENIIDVGFVDYDEVLPTCDFVVHHGGAGITHLCIAYQKLAIVIPQMYDQKDFAERIDHFKIGVRISKFTPKTFHNAFGKIKELQQNSTILANFSKQLHTYQTGTIIHTMIEEILLEEEKR